MSEQSSIRRDLDPRRGERRSQVAAPEAAPAAPVSSSTRSRIAASAWLAVSPSTERTPRLGLVQLEQAGDADHEELVEVLGEDRRELDALEERQRVVLRDLEHARVELERRELPVEEPRLGAGR